MAAEDPRIPLLGQIPGLSVKLAMMVLAGIGDISHFPTHKHLVGYAGLGRVSTTAATITGQGASLSKDAATYATP